MCEVLVFFWIVVFVVMLGCSLIIKDFIMDVVVLIVGGIFGFGFIILGGMGDILIG